MTMKTINRILLAGIVSVLAIFDANEQMSANQSKPNKLENQLTSRPAVVNMPVYQLLNTPGNEALMAFFFTPVKDKALLKDKKIAVIATDDFEEIE